MLESLLTEEEEEEGFTANVRQTLQYNVINIKIFIFIINEINHINIYHLINYTTIKEQFNK